MFIHAVTRPVQDRLKWSNGSSINFLGSDEAYLIKIVFCDEVILYGSSINLLISHKRHATYSISWWITEDRKSINISQVTNVAGEDEIRGL